MQKDNKQGNAQLPLPRGEASALLRRERQAAALRDNLAKRKAQSRARKAEIGAAPNTSKGHGG